jgi:hypothetical protein
MKHVKMRRIRPVAGLLLALGLGFGSAARADEKGAPPQMDQAAMQKMMELIQPSAVHHHMAGMAGTWTTKMKMWEGPGEPATSEGTVTCEMILGGRYLISRHTGEWMGMPFEGMGIDAYDNAKKEFISLWLDNFGTGVMNLTGHSTKDNLGIDYVGTMFDPMTMSELKVRQEIRHQGPDQYTFSMYRIDEKGQDQKVMEMVGTRQK